jgi:hypothetical protein
VEQKNWTAVRQLVGYLRCDTEGELLLLNKIWALQSQIGNHFYPQQKLISKVRDGAKISKKYNTAATPAVIAHYITEAAAEQTGVGRWRYAPATPTRWVSSNGRGNLGIGRLSCGTRHTAPLRAMGPRTQQRPYPRLADRASDLL